MGTLHVRHEYTLYRMLPDHLRVPFIHIHTWGQFSIMNPFTGLFLGVRKKVDPHGHKENMQEHVRTPHRAQDGTGECGFEMRQCKGLSLIPDPVYCSPF